MRQAKLSQAEVVAAEEAKQARKGGLKLMSVRDRGYATLKDGTRVRWHTDNPPIERFMSNDGVIEVIDNTVPEGDFMINGWVYEAEELRKYLRWA